MFFILSKLLVFLIMPFWWIIALFVWMRFSKKPATKKRLGITAVCFTVLFTNPYLFRSLVFLWQPSPVDLPANQSYSAGILLGGMSGYDEKNRGYFGDNADRFIAAANLYHTGRIKKIIVSGGSGRLFQNEPAESFFLETQLIANGVKKSDIILESRSKNTYENGIYSRQIIDSFRLQPPFVLITSAIHMPRSASVFTKAGIRILPYPCDYKVIPERWDAGNYIIPSISTLYNWNFFIKEIVGYYVYTLTGKA